jgi:hypothetical protein
VCCATPISQRDQLLGKPAPLKKVCARFIELCRRMGLLLKANVKAVLGAEKVNTTARAGRRARPASPPPIDADVVAAAYDGSCLPACSLTKLRLMAASSRQ